MFIKNWSEAASAGGGWFFTLEFPATGKLEERNKPKQTQWHEDKPSAGKCFSLITDVFTALKAVRLLLLARLSGANKLRPLTTKK